MAELLKRPEASLLPGRSAFEWQRIERIVGAISFAIVGFGVAAIIGRAMGIDFLWVPALVAIGIGGFGVAWSNSGPLGAARDRREVAAGYTTCPSPYRPELPLLDYRTGDVVRAIGAPDLGQADYVRRVAASKGV